MIPELTVRQIRVDLYRGGEPSHDIIQRAPNELWALPSQPIDGLRPIQWTHYAKDSQIMVPLLPYLVEANPAHALAYMTQLGLLAGTGIGRPVSRIHLSLGQPVQQVEHEGRLMWQVQVGIGLVLR